MIQNVDLGSLKIPEGIDAKNGNCGIVALASVTGLTLDQVQTLYTKLNPDKKPNRRRRNGHINFSTGIAGRIKVLDDLGVKYKTDMYGYLGFCLTKFVKYYAKRDVTYMVTTTKHVQIVRNGMVIDQSGAFPIRKYWARQKRINQQTLIFE